MPASVVIKIISGGQTGVDRAALDVALERGIPCGGWCPRGRKAEDGPIAARYPLKETASSDYAQRTRWNVRDADGTLILTHGKPSGGTAQTIEEAARFKKPYLVMDLARQPPREAVRMWAQQNAIRILNVAGPRESKCHGIYREAKAFLRAALFWAPRSAGRRSSSRRV